jgi:hypothetical protein
VSRLADAAARELVLGMPGLLGAVLLVAGAAAAASGLLAFAIILTARDRSPIEHVLSVFSRWMAIVALVLLAVGLLLRMVAWMGDVA